MEFCKNKEYFVGIDSDGTVFDSMKIKHTFSFVPAAVIVFGLEGCADAFKKAEGRINLYSLTRGINRFPGLLMALEEIDKSGTKIEGLDDFREFLDSGLPLSEKGVLSWLEKNSSEMMDKVLQWSRLSDSFFEKGTESLPPFEAATEVIEKMNEKADIMVVSAASTKGLEKDWKKANLENKVSFIAGQDFGKKRNNFFTRRVKGSMQVQCL